jgi:hypothetical protein
MKIKIGKNTTIQKNEDSRGWAVSSIFGNCVSGPQFQDPDQAFLEVINRIKHYSKPPLQMKK